MSSSGDGEIRIILNRYLEGSHRRAEGAPEEKIPANNDEAIANIEKWYSAGVPFFTREAIQQIDEQLQRPFEPGQKIIVEGLDGSSLEFDVQTGKTYPYYKKEFKSELRKPVISYASYVQMKSRVRERGTCMITYFPLKINHKVLTIHKATNEVAVPSLKDLRDVKDHFKASLQSWKASAAYRQLESILSTSATKHQITKVIGIGCGSIAWDNGPPDWANRLYEQHALIHSVRDWAADKESQEVECYAQDPAYSTVDKAVLGDNGIQVIDDPRAWLEVDDSSVVFSRYPDVPVKEIIADLARPAVLICNRVIEDDGVVMYGADFIFSALASLWHF